MRKFVSFQIYSTIKPKKATPNIQETKMPIAIKNTVKQPLKKSMLSTITIYMSSGTLQSYLLGFRSVTCKKNESDHRDTDNMSSFHIHSLYILIFRPLRDEP